MIKHPDERFCANIQQIEGVLWQLDRVIRIVADDSTGRVLLSKVVDGVPPFSLQSAEQARGIARQLADVNGFAADEILWEQA